MQPTVIKRSYQYTRVIIKRGRRNRNKKIKHKNTCRHVAPRKDHRQRQGQLHEMSTRRKKQNQLISTVEKQHRQEKTQISHRGATEKSPTRENKRLWKILKELDFIDLISRYRRTRGNRGQPTNNFLYYRLVRNKPFGPSKTFNREMPINPTLSKNILIRFF
jgi:hypothetical protein